MTRYVLKLLHCFFFYPCYVSSEYLTLPEGSKCTWNGVGGTCVHVYRCLSAEEDIFKRNNPPPICEYQGKDPIICCTDCSLVNDTRKIIFSDRLGYLYKNGRKAHDKCIDFINDDVYSCTVQKGVDVTWRLNAEKNCYFPDIQETPWFVSPSGGTTVRRNEYPHMALLGYGSDESTLQWLCGGSLISHNFILTAAHCISTPVLGPVIYVALGILKRSDPPDAWRRYKVKTIIPHPDYKAPSKYHDIALLETDRPVSFNPLITEAGYTTVQPACLHVVGQLDENATATGWGSTGYRKDLADSLLSVELERYKDEECMVNYPPHRHLKNGFNSTTQMCYGDRGGIQDTCEGDSGGPLQSKEHYPEHCVYTILGVTSYGKACEVVGNSGMYTRVQYYVPWIESVVWP